MGNKRVNGSRDISRDVFFLQDSSSRWKRVELVPSKKKKRKFGFRFFNTIITLINRLIRRSNFLNRRANSSQRDIFNPVIFRNGFITSQIISNVLLTHSCSYEVFRNYSSLPVLVTYRQCVISIRHERERAASDILFP